MTEPTRYAALAARLLRERPAAKESRLSRDVGISVVAHAVAMRRKRRSARLWGLGLGLVAAAALAFSFEFAWRPATTAARCHGAGCASEHDGNHRGLDAGQSIVAPASAPTSVVLASGTQIALDAKSVLECRDATATQRYALLRGGAHLHVAKLHQNERFLVDTPHAEVEVRGTVFDVTVEPATPECTERTLVSVREGRVEVHATDGAHVALLAGQHWSSPCMPAAPAAESPEATPTSTAAKPPSVTSKVQSGVVRGEPSRRPAVLAADPIVVPVLRAPLDLPATNDEAKPRASSLSEQNDLYAAAESARLDGRSAEALALFSRLLADFPRGQLAESATVSRARLLAHADPAGARSEAERYLARYPTGFARSEMEALARVP
jgi:ferric-dicitrate binding protein FerR (iron transport regulator)